MAETPNKGFALMTRLPSGVLGFRQLIKVTTSGPVPLVRVVLDNGHAVTITASSHKIGVVKLMIMRSILYRLIKLRLPVARILPYPCAL